MSTYEHLWSLSGSARRVRHLLDHGAPRESLGGRHGSPSGRHGTAHPSLLGSTPVAYPGTVALYGLLWPPMRLVRLLYASGDGDVAPWRTRDPRASCSLAPREMVRVRGILDTSTTTTPSRR